jgi:uncharacterized phage protein (TIGR02216 family)
LRLAPEAFWRMTPREPSHAIDAVLGPRDAALERASFAALMARYSDS